MTTVGMNPNPLSVENGFTEKELEYLALVDEIDSQRLWMWVAIDEYNDILERKKRAADPDFDEIFDESLSVKVKDFYEALAKYDAALAKMTARRRS